MSLKPLTPRRQVLPRTPSFNFFASLNSFLATLALKSFYSVLNFNKQLIPYLLFLLTACLPAPEVLPTITPISSPTETATIVWFPPTNTPTLTPQPLPTSTPEGKPGLTDFILEDGFADSSAWTLHDSADGYSGIKNGRMTLAVNAADYLLTSLRNDLILMDFYVEATAHVSLCKDNDALGIIFRAYAARQYYRFGITCNGEAHVGFQHGFQLDYISPSAPSGDAPHGAPSDVKIGVWVAGREMRFFLNDRYQFTLTHREYSLGSVGVFAYANSDTPVTVIFSNFIVRRVEYVPPTSTPKP